MGSCTRRHFLLSTCFLQMITIIERQVFDFLGYMWAPILVNFFHILFIIFGFYGAYHFRIKYIITYLIWNFLWIGWNSFLICFYLNVGTLDRDSDLLNLGTGSVSWFEVNGYGCKPIYNTNITSEDPYRPLRPESVEDCLLTYDIVEVVHSGVQCILAFFGILGAILISYIFLDEDDRFDFMNGDAKSPQHTVVHPMYVSYTSIPTSASGTMLSNKHQNHTLNHHQHHLHNHPNHQQNTLSNSNNHLNNSTHAISTTITTTPITTTTITSTTTNNNKNYNNSCNTPLATKKKFSSSSLANSIQQQQQTSLHKQILTANATTATNNYNNNINNSNSISHSHSNSNRNSSNSNQHNNNISNSNTFLIHSHNSNSRSRGAAADISSYNGSLLSNASQYQPYNSGGSRRNRQHRNMSPSLSTASNSLSHMLYSPKQGRKVQPSSSNSIFPANIDLAQKQPIIPAYYDDSTAKADHQLYVNGSRRQILIAQSPNQDTTPSLSYASLQNSTQNLNSSFKQNATPSNALSSSLSNSNYSLTNSLNNNQMAAVSGASGSGTSGHFARIHSKPKPAKSSSYSSFKHSASASNQPPDLKYNQIFNENSARSNTSPDQQQPEFEECFEEDDFSVQNLKTDEGVTYIPFTKPTPGNYFLTPPPPPSTQSGNNNKPNPTLGSLSSQNSLNNNSHQQQQFPPASISPNNNTSVPHMYHDNSAILLEHGAILQPLTPHELSPAQRALMYQQNGLPFHPAYSPVPYRQNSACTAQKPTPRPTNIPLPKVPDTYHAEFLSPSEVTPPPPPLPRPHIFQPRTGTAPYPDLSPEVTERYAMPTQYIPRSPVATRIARRQRQQNASNERSHGPSANYCDQIRDTTNGYGPDSTAANTYTISKARSYDRLTSSQSVNGSFKDSKRNAKTKTEELTSPPPNSPLSKDMAPHVNRRSGRRDGQKARPRSYCNSMSGGEGVIRVKHVNKKAKHRQSLYSIEFGPSLDTIRSRADTILDYGDDQMHERCGGLEADNGELSPKPMTPRRVKRRSVMHRGSNNRQSTASRRSSSHSSHKNTLRGESRDGSGGAGSMGTHSRSSTRSSRRKYHQNPVTKLLDQQQLQQQQSTMHIHSHHGKQQLGSFHHKESASSSNSTAALTVSNLQSLNQEIHNNINAVSSSQTAGAGSLTKTNNNHYQSFRKNIPPDPIYYNTNAQTAYIQQQQWQQQMQQTPSPIPTLDEPQSPTLTLTPSLGGGHYNPTYQHSTTNLNDADHVDELYNNRPPSVRSSYSNFHGARSMSSYMSTTATTENVFVNLVASNTAQNSSSAGTSTFSQQQQQQQQQPQQQPPQLPHESPATPPLYQQHPLHQQHTLSQHSLPPPPPLPDPPYASSQPQAIPFHKRTASRESIRSMAFLNSGPPAYNLNYHTPPDSETTM